MATTITKWIFLTILSLLVKTQMLVHAQQQVPCLFFFGDSQFDNGNNNWLITRAKVNYKPYGIDYPDGPTGRFSNGQNIADFLARLLGFAAPIPPYVTTSVSDIVRGLNYASGAGGILDESGAQLGDRFSMNRQLQLHQLTKHRIPGILRNRTAVDEYLRQCLYVVNIGSNDYINNYYLPTSPSRSVYSPQRFAELLIQKFSQQLRTLYNIGSRKVAVFGLGLIGCVPQELAQFPTNGSPCVDAINTAVGLFNERLFPLINNLNSDLSNARFTYINVTSISLGDPSDIGIRVVNAPCCEVERSTGQCVENRTPCSNRREYAFWDNFHPTEVLNNVTASRAYTKLFATDASPVDIRTLVQQ